MTWWLHCVSSKQSCCNPNWPGSSSNNSFYSYFLFSLPVCQGSGPEPCWDPVPDGPAAGADWHGDRLYCVDRVTGAVYDVEVPGCHARLVDRGDPHRQPSAPVHWPGHYCCHPAPDWRGPAGRRWQLHGGSHPAGSHRPTSQLQNHPAQRVQ